MGARRVGRAAPRSQQEAGARGSPTAQQIADALHVNLKVGHAHGKLQRLWRHLNVLEDVVHDARDDTAVERGVDVGALRMAEGQEQVSGGGGGSVRVAAMPRAARHGVVAGPPHLHRVGFTTGRLAVGEDGAVVALEHIWAEAATESVMRGMRRGRGEQDRAVARLTHERLLCASARAHLRRWAWPHSRRRPLASS